ncbi:unnamed protein product [Victoria cruziana]
MISTTRLVEMARKWKKMAAVGRRRISLGKVVERRNSRKAVAVAVADKGHFVAYALDGKRFMLPLSYLQLPIFQQLLMMAGEEFGLNIEGAITFPCDSSFVEQVVALLKKDKLGAVENSLLVMLASKGCLPSSSLPPSHPFRHAMHNVI